MNNSLFGLLDENGMTYTITNREGVEMIKIHPAASIKADVWRRVMIGLGKFGLSPSDREKISITPVNKKSPFDEFNITPVREKNPVDD